MKAVLIKASLLVAFVVSPALASARAPHSSPQQKQGQQQSQKTDGAAAAAKSEIPLPEVPRISAEELKRMMDQKSKVIIVDTRDSLTYDDGHLAGAVNIYYDPTVDPSTREASLSALPADTLVVLYCECNNEEDSAPMVEEMWKLGYDHDKVKALKGGSIRWRLLKYGFVSTPTDASAEKTK